MEGQPFFTTIAGLSVSLAGFGAVIRETPGGGTRSISGGSRTIVRHALTIVFLCLTLVPIHSFTQDDMTTVRIGSALVALLAISDVWRVRHPDPVVWDPLSLRVFVTTSVVYLLLGIVNVVVASLGLLQALIMILLTSPAAIFSNFVREMGASPGSAAESDPAE